MTRETKRKISTFIRYTLLLAVGFIMVYPLIWMVGATFKTNSEIFTSAWFWPRKPVSDGYANAFVDYGGKINLIKSMLNTYKILAPKVLFTVVSATITAYGFGRFEFKGKGILFSLMISTLFLPQVVLNAPQYIMFNKWGWDQFLPASGDSFPVCRRYLFLIHAHTVFKRRAKGAGGSCQDRWLQFHENLMVCDCSHAKAIPGICCAVSVYVDFQRLYGTAYLCFRYAQIYEFHLFAHVHGR